NCLPSSRVILLAWAHVTGASGNGVDDDQAERQSKLRLEGCIGLPRHGDQSRHSILVVQQYRAGLVPPERYSLYTAAFVMDHSIETQPHLVRALSSNQKHAALPLHRVTEKWLAGGQRSRQIKRNERLARPPLTTEQPMPDRRKEVFDQPALD